MNWRLVSLIGLLALVMGTALMVVWSTHETRWLFLHLDRLDTQHDALTVEWGRLELEQSVWGAHERVSRIAREQLHMIPPTHRDTVFVQP